MMAEFLISKLPVKDHKLAVNVAGKHGVPAAAQRKWRLKTGKCQDFCHDVLSQGVHASSANGANLFVGQDGDGRYEQE